MKKDIWNKLLKIFVHQRKNKNGWTIKNFNFATEKIFSLKVNLKSGILIKNYLNIKEFL